MDNIHRIDIYKIIMSCTMILLFYFFANRNITTNHKSMEYLLQIMWLLLLVIPNLYIIKFYLDRKQYKTDKTDKINKTGRIILKI